MTVLLPKGVLHHEFTRFSDSQIFMLDVMTFHRLTVVHNNFFRVCVY